MKYLLLVLSLVSTSAWALDDNKCSNFLNDGWYMKYKWAGIGSAQQKAVTAETRRTNTTAATLKVNTQNTTASSDPKYWGNVTTSNAQFTSSWGPCSALGLQLRQQERELYVAQNLEEIKKDVANNKGGHLEVLSWFSMCEDSAVAEFNSKLQQAMPELVNLSAPEFSKKVDAIIAASPELSQRCTELGRASLAQR